MWISIFEAMGQPSDLLKVIKTCKHFYALAIRVLYRNLHWISPLPFASNARFWRQQTNAMTDAPNSLVIGISHINSNSFARFDPSAAIVELDGSWNIAPQATHISMGQYQPFPPFAPSTSDWKRYSFFASKALYDTMLQMITTFGMLQELVFHHADLPEAIYATIKSLPRLRNLAIQYCSLPVINAEPDLTFADLPITSLTLWCSKADPGSSTTSTYLYALHLCTARNLRVLKVDWTSVTARFFALTNPVPPAVLPRNINDLSLRMPVSKLWPAEGEASRSMLLVPLVRFLRNSPSITRLTIFNRLPSLELDTAILPNLHSYIGPSNTVPAVLKYRPVEHLEITDMDKKLHDYMNLLPEVAKFRPELKTLCLVLREWDNEILHAIGQLFTDLRKISITYEDKYPSEVRTFLCSCFISDLSLLLLQYTLLSLGSQFLYRFPLMESLQLYQTTAIQAPPESTLFNQPAMPSFFTRQQGPGSANDEDVKELIVPWRKHSRHLREVQFMEGFVWRRAHDGDQWCKRNLPAYDRFKELTSC